MQVREDQKNFVVEKRRVKETTENNKTPHREAEVKKD